MVSSSAAKARHPSTCTFMTTDYLSDSLENAAWDIRTMKVLCQPSPVEISLPILSKPPPVVIISGTMTKVRTDRNAGTWQMEETFESRLAALASEAPSRSPISRAIFQLLLPAFLGITSLLSPGTRCQEQVLTISGTRSSTE